MVDISTKAIERMSIEKPKCGYIQPMLALAAERDMLRDALKDMHLAFNTPTAKKHIRNERANGARCASAVALKATK